MSPLLFSIFMVFFVSILAKTNKYPFDLAEIESELVTTYNVKYSFIPLALFIWIKASIPRFGCDQLMRLGWKIFLPFSLIWVISNFYYPFICLKKNKYNLFNYPFSNVIFFLFQ